MNEPDKEKEIAIWETEGPRRKAEREAHDVKYIPKEELDDYNALTQENEESTEVYQQPRQ